MRERAGICSGARRATVIAYDTMVSTADSPMFSARIQTPNVVTNCRMIALGMCSIRSVRRSVTQPSTGPTTTLPATASRKVGATADSEKPPAATAPIASR